MTASGKSSPAATRADVLALARELDDASVNKILSLRPTRAELSAAAMWAAGDGSAEERARHPLAGVVAEIYEILSADEEEEPPPAR